MTRVRRWRTRPCHCVIPAQAGIGFASASVSSAAVVDVEAKDNSNRDEPTFVA
jgi:hypothetical protein